MNQVRSVFAAWPLTPMVKKILIAIGGAWALSVILVTWLQMPTPYNMLCLTPTDVIGHYRIWQVFTYMWLHDAHGFSHILFNGLFLWMFGGVLEQAWGSKAFFMYYLICGIGAGLIVLIAGALFYPSIPTVGASGAIYGLVIAWAITFPNRIIYLFGVLPIKGKFFALIPIGFALLDFFTRGSGVSHAAHLGGILVGALLTTGYWRPRKIKNKLRYMLLKRKLHVLDGEKTDQNEDSPPGGGYWN